jgi:hypothetical protein
MEGATIYHSVITLNINSVNSPIKTQPFRYWWLMPVIIAIHEAEIRRIMV